MIKLPVMSHRYVPGLKLLADGFHQRVVIVSSANIK